MKLYLFWAGLIFVLFMAQAISEVHLQIPVPLQGQCYGWTPVIGTFSLMVSMFGYGFLVGRSSK